jgi:tRNA (adenine37-N6)-methyltransferase
MTDESEPVLLHPIGHVRCAKKYRYETARQGVLAPDSTATIELLPRHNFEQALKDISDFERIWVLSLFHLNRNWKPLVHVPRHRRDKVGVFATRAPYRPNPIGLSCVTLLSVQGLSLTIGNVDLLDGTPVLDLKPYLPYADAFPDAGTGWVKNACSDCYAIDATDEAMLECGWIRTHAGINLPGFIEVQLQHAPRDTERKRITPAAHEDEYVLAYRTWRIFYRVLDFEKRVVVTHIRSGYFPEELAHGMEDKYRDKTLHRRYLQFLQESRTGIAEPESLH